jgi:hypothetical protein
VVKNGATFDNATTFNFERLSDRPLLARRCWLARVLAFDLYVAEEDV